MTLGAGVGLCSMTVFLFLRCLFSSARQILSRHFWYRNLRGKRQERKEKREELYKEETSGEEGMISKEERRGEEER
jgi:hypothetical protein